MIKNKIIKTLAIVAVLSSPVALAQVLDLPKGQTSGEFSCNIDSIKPFVKVNIDTDSVEVLGFCDGQPNVTSKGHIKDMSKSDLNDHYFQFKKDALKSGSITVSSSSDVAIVCSIGKGNKTKAYGTGGYC